MKYLLIVSSIILLSLNSVFAQKVSADRVENKEANPCKKPKDLSSSTEIPEGFRPSDSSTSMILQGWTGRKKVNSSASIQIPVIEKLTLSQKEIIYNPTDKNSRLIDVEVKVTDPENYILTYNYTVSSGQIIGQGSKVKWDLCGAEPGTYTITATIDDGCGVCAEPKTETIEILREPKTKGLTEEQSKEFNKQMVEKVLNNK